VSWRVEPGEAAASRLVLDWKERGGPSAKMPSGRGFGSRLIDSSVRHELEGSATMQLEPEGLNLVLHVPLKNEATSLQTS